MCSYGLTNSYFFYEFIMIYWLPAFKVLNIWIFYGYSMGYSMDILWIFYGYSMCIAKKYDQTSVRRLFCCKTHIS